MIVNGLDTSVGLKVPNTNTADDASAQAIQGRFISLLVTQLKNQDPLKPMDNAAVTNQMAQLSTVTGIESLNKTMGSVRDAIGSSLSLQATQMIDRAVLFEASSFMRDRDEPMQFVTQAPAGDYTLRLKNVSGQVVHEQAVKALGGRTVMSWDGRTTNGAAPLGAYRVELVDAVSQKPLPVLLEDRVVSMRSAPGQGGVMLRTRSGAELAFGQVVEVR